MNAVDPQRLLLGGSGHLYGSLNQGGTITSIATVGVNGTFYQGPIAYGGYENGVAKPDVFYLGSGSNVYKRTTAGGAVIATATNSGTYAHHGPAPLAISASTGTVDQQSGPRPLMNVLGYWQLGEDDAGAAPGSLAIQVNALDSSSLQALIATTPIVYLAPASDAALQSEAAAINGLTAPATPVGITIVLGAGPYSGVTLSPPSGIVLDLAGNSTVDSAGTQIASASGPAVTVTAGEVFVQGDGLATSADAPTVLVTGGHLTLGQNNIQESTGFNNVAIALTGGSVDLGFDMLLNINGQGGFFRSYDPDAVGFPEGVDAELTPNTYAVNGVRVSATFLSATNLTSSAATSVFGQPVTFTAAIDVEADEQGPATGTVTFYDGATASSVTAKGCTPGRGAARSKISPASTTRTSRRRRRRSCWTRRSTRRKRMRISFLTT